ncbi:hypothetical protein BSK65_08485 [Paenibacillus odorifer]|uniref:DUF4309 domain-containing protein n=1 Tax=Paenibacillus odorifer TaxID=189426 RepID=A0A1R0ZL98_9BACL|nr:hypothetical protein [Paenibacillus odorifer]OME72389.1 hypothetical protein BSK65_08485 [Paenibacillus odorifer]
MKKRVVEATLVAAMLFSVVLGQGVVAKAETVTSVVTAKPTTSAIPTATVKPIATPVPIMRDNLSKFGLKKDLELPVTISAGGLSYTLEKLMVYDVKSKDAQELIKKYGYREQVFKQATKYMVWTKITIANDSHKLVQQTSKSPTSKWIINTNGSNLAGSMPKLKADEINSKEALWNWKLQPGQKLSTYQMYVSTEDITNLKILIYYGGGFDEKIIVKRQGE